MRYLLIISLLCIGLFQALPPVTADANQWPLEIFEVMDDEKIVVFLNNDDIIASPTWDPATGGPPLSIADALKHLHTWNQKNNPDSNAKVHEIELKPIHGHEQEGHWYYLVQMRSGKNMQARTTYAIVLLNGSIVPAIAEPKSYK